MRNNKKKVIGLIIILAVVLILSIVIPTFNINDVYARISNNLPVSHINEEFPDSYKPYIEELKKIYPNAKFKAIHTNVDWNLAVTHETYETNLGISTIYKTYGDEWKHKPNGVDINIDGGFVAASKEAVKYVLDPRNSLTREYVFQFESLNYSEGLSSTSAVDKVLINTPMSSSGQYGRKYKNNGNWIDMEKTYAEYIYEAGKKHNISPTHIASRIIQETRGDIVNNESINGSRAGLTGLYNFFNIGATPGNSGNSAIYNGLVYARNKGWTTPSKSIIDGSYTLADKYIKWGQNTIYFQKFDVNNPGQADHLFGTQYMTHILAPRSESLITHKAYNSAGMLDSSFEFHIPVYLNMPASTIDYPGTGNNVLGGNSGETNPLNIKIYLDDKISNGTDTFNFRSSPNSSSSSNIIKKLYETKDGMENRNIYTLISRDTNTGWSKIRTNDGLEGYIFSQYVHEYTYTKVESLTLNNDDIKIGLNNTFNLIVNVNPSNAKYKDLIYKISDESIASIDNQGKITAKKIGETTVTVINEDSGKKVEGKIKVVSNIEKIEFIKNEYNVYVNKNILVEPKITSEFNKEYELSIEDSNIAVVENGKIKGIKVGTTNIIAKLKNTDKTAKVKLNVVENNVENPVIFDETLKVDDKNYITNVNPETKVKDILNKINTSHDIKITNANDEVLTNDMSVGTGTKISITNNKGLNLKYVVVVYGDVNGDGIIDAVDLLMIKKHIVGTYTLKNGFYEAALLTKTNGQITAVELLKLKKHIVGTYTIEQ